MKPAFKRILGILFRCIVALLMLSVILLDSISKTQHEIMYGSDVMVYFSIVIVFCFVLVVVYDVFSFKKHKTKWSLLPTFLGILMIIASVSINRCHHNILNQSNYYTVKSIEFEREGIQHQCFIDFKTDNSYVICEFTEGMYVEYYYGRFKQKGNLIELDHKNGKLLNTKYFKILNETNSYFQLVQTNADGIQLKDKFEFELKKHTLN